MEDLEPHLMYGSLDSRESSTEMASLSVQPFIARLTSVTDRQTDHTTRSVTTGHIYIHSTAKWPKN